MILNNRLFVRFQKQICVYLINKDNQFNYLTIYTIAMGTSKFTAPMQFQISSSHRFLEVVTFIYYDAMLWFLHASELPKFYLELH